MSDCQLIPLLILYDYLRPGSLQGKLLMSLTYGYDLKDDDKILEAPHQTTRLMAPLVLPGAALVNHVPICAISNFVLAALGVPYIYLSATHSLMGPILQLQTGGTNCSDAE